MKRPRFSVRLRKAVRALLGDTQPVLIEPDFPETALTARDRQPYDREELLRQSLAAWQANPLARRIVELTSQYVAGGGISISSPHPAAQDFLQQWWNHPLNGCPVRVFEWCDELTRSGELFFLASTDAAGMTYLRAVPALQVSEVRCAENDLQQETGYVLRPEPGALDLDPVVWPAAGPALDVPGPDGRFPVVMLHYAVNRPVGAVRGEPDLAPLLRWLALYSGWLENRARLNHFRNAFLYVVRTRFTSEAERAARQSVLQAHPPTPGSILVTDETENWDVLSPRLDADEAGADGLALKKMIAAGAGIPLHFLAEPESATRTTAESAGGPAFRRLEQRQKFFLWMVTDLARLALRRRAALDFSLGRAETIPLSVRGGDLSARDNHELAAAAETIVKAFLPLYRDGLVAPEELLRMAYRFAGEGGEENPTQMNTDKKRDEHK
jgi:hypothetical protein